MKRRSDLMSSVVPFFEEHPLITAKRADFERFAAVLRVMEAGGHLHEDASFGMNAAGKLSTRGCGGSLLRLSR